MNTPHLLSSLMLALAVAMTALACDDDKPSGEAQESSSTESEAKKGAGSPSSGDNLSKVSVADEGTKFDPPIEKSQLPDGVWYCDMKTVHYAAKSEGDGKCPYCGMKLKKIDAAAETKEAAAHGHDHGDGEHDHEHGEGEHGHEH